MAALAIKETIHRMGRVLVHVQGPAELSQVDGLLHDMAFDMNDVSVDEQQEAVEIRFYRSPKTRHAFRPGHRDQAAPARSCAPEMQLRICHVMTHQLRDPEGLVTHSYAHLRQLADGQLSLDSNFPGSIELRVSELDVEVTELDQP